MEVLICAQWELEALAETPFDSPTALISIGDPGTPPPVLRHRTQHILRLEFDDARAPDAGQALTPAQAEQIAAFVYTHKDSVQTLICQCGFGCSRSAAVAAAVKEHFTRDGLGLFTDGEHHPNILVFSAVLKALEKTGLRFGAEKP
mgnify:CR=1 FL=1